jgi:DNA-directed RNA polymerase specialized sigma24 family protein
LTAYDQLREIGVSVETADALAPILDELPAKKREAFILWASGVSERNISKILGVSKGYVWFVIQYVKDWAK